MTVSSSTAPHMAAHPLSAGGTMSGVAGLT